jgi:predicted regulator of Ras-like GTPase activity (Roadblock/LC7/MglB family)
MSVPFQAVLNTIMRQRGVTGCIVVDARDGVIVSSTLQFGMRGNVVAALMASLVKKAQQSATAAGLGEASFVQLDAEQGRVCAVEAEGLVLVAVADLRASVALLRVALLDARAALVH